MSDFYKMSSMMKNLFPSDPQADLQALKAMANAPAQEAMPQKDYVKESVHVPQGSMPVGIDNVSDFAKLAGIVTEGKQKTGSAGQAKGKDPMPTTSKPSKTGEQPHPLKDKLVGEDGVDQLALTPSAQVMGGALDPDVDDSALIARGLKKASEGDVLTTQERAAIAPYVELFSLLITNPAFRQTIISMQKTLKKSKGSDDEIDLMTDESGILYKAGVEKYGQKGMQKIQSAAGKGASAEEIGAIKDKYNKKKKQSTESIKERLYRELNQRKI